MIRLGVRLAIAGGKEAITRLALVAVATAIGVGLLLTTIATMNAYTAQDHRYAWLETGFDGVDPVDPEASAGDVDPLWWSLQSDYFLGDRIGRLDLAQTGPDSPSIPGIAELPRPGEFYASPAMAELLGSTPPTELGNRFPGQQIGVLGDEALPSPDSLIVVIGRDPGELSQQPGAKQITQISTTPPSECSGECAPGVGTNANGMILVLSVVAAALLFPVLIFIAGATRLSAARREQRFAAMRLVGATQRQIAWLAVIESSVAAIAGTAVGFVLFGLLRPAMATVSFSNERFFTADVSLSWLNIVIVAIGIPLAAAVAARISLRRVSISPLGVTRRVTPPPPKVIRLLPLLAGIGWLVYLAYVSDIGDSSNSQGQAFAYLAGIFTIMIGLVVAGPWLTMAGSSLMARRAGKPVGLIAARRLGDNPKAAFRAISGLVIAVFVGTCAIGVITSVVAYGSGSAGDPENFGGTLVHSFRFWDVDGGQAPTITSAELDELSSIAGVQGVTAIRIRVGQPVHGGFDVPPAFFVSCAQMADTPALGACAPGAETAEVVPHFGGGVIDASSPMSETVWQAASRTADEVSALPIDMIVVGTDGSEAAVEQARTVLERAVPTGFPPMTLGEFKADNTRDVNSYQRLANVVLIASLPIAGCSLAVSIAGGLADRRRPFGLLRLSGTPIAMLRRVVMLEAAVPLILGVLVSAGAGTAAAALFLRAQLDQSLQAPGLSYFVLIIGGVAVSLGIIASTLPLLGRLTAPEAVRND